MCCTSLACRNADISCETSWGPLSETSCEGDPKRLNLTPGSLIVSSVVVDVVVATSDRLLCALTGTRNILSSNDPAKSVCTRCHGSCGNSHGQREANGGFFLIL